jgi:hypothetical protein
MSHGGSYAFQPFNSPLQMLVTVKANMPILTLDSIFSNGERLKNVEKLILKRKSIIEEVFIFQDTQEEDVAPFTPKMKQPQKKLASKKMVKAKEGKEHRDEESKKN